MEERIKANKTYEPEELLLEQLRSLSKESKNPDSQELLVGLSNAMVSIYNALNN